MTERGYVVRHVEEFELEVSAEWEFEDLDDAHAFADPLEPLTEFAGGRIIAVQTMKSFDVPADAPYVVEVRLQYGYPYVADLTGQAVGAAWDQVNVRGATQLRVDATKRSFRVVSSE